eukprot:tig00020553_g10752.t1
MELDEERIADHVHGEIVLRGWLLKAFRHRVVQRLVHLQQLGGACIINSNLIHTRLSHSVGVAHLARLWAEQLRRECPGEFAEARRRFRLRDDEQLVDVFALAGLLHDVGHAMFSHTFEIFAEMRGVEFDHELISVMLVQRVLTDIGLDFGGAAVDLCKRMICPKRKSFDAFCPDAAPIVRELDDSSWLLQLVSGAVDVDRMDYLDRDTVALLGQRGLARAAAEHLRGHARLVAGRLAFPADCPACAKALLDLGRARAEGYLYTYNEPRVKGVEVMYGRAMLHADAALRLSERAQRAAARPCGSFEDFCVLVDLLMHPLANITDEEIERFAVPPKADPAEAREGLRKARGIMARISQRQFYWCTRTAEVLGDVDPEQIREEVAGRANELLKGAERPAIRSDQLHFHKGSVGYGNKAKSPLEGRAFYERRGPKGEGLVLSRDTPYVLRVQEPAAFESRTLRVYIADDEGPRCTREQAAAVDAAFQERAAKRWGAALAGFAPAPVPLGPPPGAAEEEEDWAPEAAAAAAAEEEAGTKQEEEAEEEEEEEEEDVPMTQPDPSAALGMPQRGPPTPALLPDSQGTLFGDEAEVEERAPPAAALLSAPAAAAKAPPASAKGGARPAGAAQRGPSGPVVGPAAEQRRREHRTLLDHGFLPVGPGAAPAGPAPAYVDLSDDGEEAAPAKRSPPPPPSLLGGAASKPHRAGAASTPAINTRFFAKRPASGAAASAASAAVLVDPSEPPSKAARGEGGAGPRQPLAPAPALVRGAGGAR